MLSERLRWPARGIFALAVLTAALAQLPMLIASRWSLFDLRIYLDATHLVLHGGSSSLYTAVFNGAWVYTYPPFSVVVFTPLEWLPGGLATAVFSLASLLALARICLQASRAMITGWLADHRTTASPAIREVTAYAVASVMLLVVITADPERGTFGFGQVNLILAWMVTEDYLGLGAWADRRGVRGALVGIAAGIKLTPGLSWLPRVLARQARPAIAGAIAGLGTIIVSAVLLPNQTVDYFTNVVWNANRPGDTWTEWNQSLNGMVHRLVGQHGQALPPTVILGGLALVAGMYAATVLLRDGDPLGTVLVSAVTTYLVSPVSWYHHLVLLPLLVFWVGARWRTWSRGFAIALGLQALTISVWVLPGFYQFVPSGGAEFKHNVGQVILSEGVPAFSLLFVVTVALAMLERRTRRDEIVDREEVSVTNR